MNDITKIFLSYGHTPNGGLGVKRLFSSSPLPQQNIITHLILFCFRNKTIGRRNEKEQRNEAKIKITVGESKGNGFKKKKRE